jgi:hypothetical protein
MPVLASRPLTTSDAPLYVPRDADVAVRNALRARENVLLGAVRGAGATSLLYRLEAELPDALLINAERAASASDVVASVIAQLKVRPILPELQELLRRPDPLAAPPIMRRLRESLDEAERTPIVLLDGPIDPKISFELFGRWRDELFALPINWIVLAHQERLAEYVTPPADVFFDAIISLDLFDAPRALEVLERRDVGQLPDSVAEALVRHFDGTPRHLIRLARGALASDPSEAARHAEEHAAAAQSLSRGAQRLLADMQGRGPVTATDAALLQRLGITDRQMRRNLAELEAAGLAELLHSSSSSQGRPPATYRLTPLGQMEPSAE